MTSDTDRLREADRSFIGSYEKLVEHVEGGSSRWFGSVFAFVSDLPLDIFNGVVVLEPPNAADLDAACDWVGDADVPHGAWVREAIAEGPARQLEERGFERLTWVEPVMAIEPPPEPPHPAPGVSVKEVTDEAGLEEHRRQLIAGGFPEAVTRRMYVSSFMTDPDVRVFTAYLDGQPMGNSIAIRTGTVAGVYAVGTRLEARRRGLGTAATWAAVDAGRQWGCPKVVLQSSEMGLGVYRSMGFRVIDGLVLLRGAPPRGASLRSSAS